MSEYERVHYISVCLCYYCIGLLAHSIISGYPSDDADDDVSDDNDRYDCLGYRSDFKEFLDGFFD